MRTFFGDTPGPNTGNIVAMDRFRSGRSLSPIRQAEAYWTALLHADSVPNRSDIDPRGLENVLEHTFVLERIAPSVARFRLAGNHLRLLAGMEVRGMPLTAFFTAAAREDIADLLLQVFDGPAICELEMTSEPKRGRLGIEARLILLPLKSDLGDVSRILGVMVGDGGTGQTPYRFDIAQKRVRGLDSIRRGRSAAPLTKAAFAEDQAQFASAPPHLRLVPPLRD